jgi:predicted alpha/beta-fold hydrolase
MSDQKLYKKPVSLQNGHFETLIPYFFRIPPRVKYKRTRIQTEDGDFLDLDWSKVAKNNGKLIVLNHGLEGHSGVQYIKGMAKIFNDAHFDCLAWNYRGCTEINKTKKFYHSGATYDLRHVLEHVISNEVYDEIYLIGFSLGGNLILKYLGEESDKLPAPIRGACVFSVPCCLESSSKNLEQGFNKVYTENFLKSMRKKIKLKEDIFKKENIDISKIDKIKTLKEFDDAYTGPLHGFVNAKDYYDKNSSKFFIADIKVDTLIVNAINDPFLTEDCHPIDIASKNPYITFELLEAGGHVGFLQKGFRNVLWSEQRAYSFIKGLSS